MDASRYLVGGVNSPMRAFRQIGAEPLMLVDGQGAQVHDAKGRTWLDFIMGWGALVLGHSHPAIVRAVRRVAEQATLLGLTHPAEVELAKLIIEAIPSVEQVRFTVSGTEACMTAVRLARASTSRMKILMFEGAYHGHGDTLMAGKSAGIPIPIAHDTLTIPFNDLPALETAIQRYGTELACVIVEPVTANMGVVVPRAGFLSRLRELTTQRGIVLIFDEVVTGFRLGLGGAQGLFGVRPDLTTFGKIIGGGLPIGALGGPRRFMQRLAPDGNVYHGGTFAGHPLTMAAGVAVLRELKARPPYDRIDQLSERLARGLMDAAAAAGVPLQVNWIGSMLTVFFSDTPVKNFSEAKASQRDRFAQWARALYADGILIPPSPFEALFLSAAHTEAHVDRFLHTAEAAFRELNIQKEKGNTTKPEAKC